MIFYTGDIHGDTTGLVQFCNRMQLAESDTVVLLGDVGINYYRNDRDTKLKESLARLQSTFLCVHGNHEIRPHNLPTYIEEVWNGGIVWVEKEHPNVKFAKDGEVYTIEGITHLVIGGAYSVDKHYRLARGYGWWEDEQPNEETKRIIEQKVAAESFDVILSHTCPLKYEPVEMFLPMIDQQSVDCSTEEWLDKIEDTANYNEWFCGHWHIDKRIDKIHFLFSSFESSDQFVTQVKPTNER